jgi:hydrogenase maturation protein HypF
MSHAQAAGRRIRIRGTVQGVGFRPWVYRAAHAAGVTGRVWNDAGGVVVDAFGDETSLARFAAALETPPPAARVEAIEIVECAAADPATTFEIVDSDRCGDRRVSIPPDLATCAACAAEVLDPADRRYRYAFTNCTSCGPRFTIATDVPYDRPATTMEPFAMCEACQREYHDPRDRRFHAQPNACPVCGPRLALYTGDGAHVHADDPIRVAAGVIADGLIVAVKGIGGFHLACDATSETAVTRLRERKRREEKPFAVMVRDLAEAGRIAVLGREERALLTSVERPIVIATHRPGSGIAAAVAPRNRRIGLMLPYSPLHHLLLADAGRPLVMTSGNLSDEPIAVYNDEALARLGGIADLLVLHDRGIASRADDSVATVIAGRPAVVRRSRGYVPRPVAVHAPFPRPVLSCGALLNNTFCLAAGSEAWLGPHIGDLENADTYRAYTDAIARYEAFLRIAPEVVAHDLHPEYLSTQYALGRSAVRHVAVQHHHAHVVAAMAEHHLEGPAIGIAFDGTGYGTDGTVWGGEVLIATARSFTRAATFRPIRLVGGDRAIRQPWRIALAMVVAAFGGTLPDEVAPLFDHVGARDVAAVLSALRGGLPAPAARGIGRYFDAFGALFLKRDRAAYEGQVAMEWNKAADLRTARTYAFAVDAGPGCDEINLGSAVREAVADYLAGEPVRAIASIFHDTLVQATALVVRRAAAAHGRLPVVASGGCFVNARLAEGVRTALSPGLDLFLPGTVPAGDGGIALGQAVVANAIAGA